MNIFYEDKKAPEQNKGNDAMADGFFRLLIAGLFLIVLPFLTVSALLGYLLLCAWRDKKAVGVAAVLFISAALIFYLVGLPREVLVDAKGHYLEFWVGSLFWEFQSTFKEFYQSLYSLFHWKINLRTAANFMKLTRYVFWASLPVGVGFWAFLGSKKEWNVQPILYKAFKAPVTLWLKLVGDPSITIGSKLGMLGFQIAAPGAVVYFILPRLPGAAWTVHLGICLLAIGSVVGLVAAILSEIDAPKDRADVISVADDGTTFSPALLNHHVHVLGESGFGKSVFLMRLIQHHIKHGMGLVFIDLKADTDTVSQIVALCERHNRLGDLKLFDCSKPDLSSPYNVLLRGNPTEIKDKLVGSFTWESEYYKNAAQSFLLTVIKALVFLRDHHKFSFSLEDIYQTTQAPETLIALQTELTTKNAPENLREDVNHLAHYLRSRENFKELHGLRTQIKLLIDSEFGELLTSNKPGIDLFYDIQNHKIVYVLLDSQRYGESAKKLGKLILQDLKSASSRIIEEIPKDQRVPCAIIVDEFADLATEQFVGFLNRSRGSKLGIVVAHQEMSDLEALSPTMRDQVMGNTATTVSFLQKMPESAERLAAIAGTKKIKKATRQLNEQGFLSGGRQYTGMESEREVEEFIIHPNTFKTLKVGECVIIGKYPQAWSKKVRIPKPEEIKVNHASVPIVLKRLLTQNDSKSSLQPLKLKELTKAQFAKAAPPPARKPEGSKTESVEIPPPPSSADPNF